MTVRKLLILICQNCGLRYPRLGSSARLERCPVCLGDATVVLEQTLEQAPPPQALESGPNAQLRVLLDNIRSAWNVGSIFRSAEAFAFSHLYLFGISPSPEDP